VPCCLPLVAVVTGSIVHAFMWVALWLLLTAKSHWDFRLKIAVGRTLLKSPSCLALAAQIEYQSGRRHDGEEGEKLLNSPDPILILSGGKAYSVQDGSVQKKINDLIQQQVHQKEDDQHQVYWLRGGTNLPSPAATESPASPTLPEPAGVSCAPGGNAKPPTPSPSVTTTVTTHTVPMSPMVTRPVRKPLMRIPNSEDDGDYATLRDLPLVTLPEEPADMHEHHETSSSSDTSSGMDSGFGSGPKRPMTMGTPVNCPRVVSRDLCNPYGYVKPKLTTFSPQHSIHSNTIAMHPIQHNVPVQHSPFHSLPMGNR
jgi:hypothetical protein